MAYLNTETKEYPVSERELRLRYPDIAFPAVLVDPPAPWVNVFHSPSPEHDPLTHVAQEIAPTLTKKGHHEQRWKVTALPAEKAAANKKAIARTSALSQIAALESTITVRRLREALQGPKGKEWLKKTDDQISVLRKQLK
jgi:hypothetical protein